MLCGVDRRGERHAQVGAEDVDDRLAMAGVSLAEPVQCVQACETDWSFVRAELSGSSRVEIGDPALSGVVFADGRSVGPVGEVEFGGALTTCSQQESHRSAGADDDAPGELDHLQPDLVLRRSSTEQAEQDEHRDRRDDQEGPGAGPNDPARHHWYPLGTLLNRARLTTAHDLQGAEKGSVLVPFQLTEQARRMSPAPDERVRGALVQAARCRPSGSSGVELGGV
ncbi:hypothetical protein [Saccharopolyspora antimicrobica]|uniref:hypothetical protein n=1 Tax=Saccharopolyspora antimicrobica TaxID=455193 RepID=UPI0014769C1B|nr:hypothetical protein [Saccharopolyspora antimicrobica]